MHLNRKNLALNSNIWIKVAEVAQINLCDTSHHKFFNESSRRQNYYPLCMIHIGCFFPLLPSLANTDATLAGLAVGKIVPVALASSTSPESHNLSEADVINSKRFCNKFVTKRLCVFSTDVGQFRSFLGKTYGNPKIRTTRMQF